MENQEVPKKRGRPKSAQLDEFELMKVFRKIALNTDELLNPNKLAKLTGIERRNWKKIQKNIDAANKVRLGNITPDAVKDYPLPSTEEVFFRCGDNISKLKESFQSLINIVSRMWEKCLSYDNAKLQYELKLAEKDRQIEELQEKLKKAKEDTEFHKAQYRQVCGESIYGFKRKQLGIPDNVIRINKGNKDVMDIDALDDALNGIYKSSKQIAATKKKEDKDKK